MVDLLTVVVDVDVEDISRRRIGLSEETYSSLSSRMGRQRQRC